MAPGILSYSSRGTSPSASAGVRTPATHSHTSSVDSLSGLAVGPYDGRRLDGVRPDGPASRSSSSSGFSRASTDEHADPDALRNGSAGRRPNQDQSSMPIAIVGMACRLPGSVASPAEFWELCSRARTGFTPVPKERFNHDTFYHPNPGKTGTYHASGGNFLDVDLAAFDAPFFGLTEKEAISMDPQQRLLLECTFEALENAGIPKHSIVGEDVGVFIGGNFAEYESHLFRDSDTIPMHQATDSGRSIAFDNRGTGFGRGEGCGMIVLKPLDQALRDNDSIRAVIRGSGINQDGKTPGITMPNGSAQEKLMRQVYRNAGLDPSDCGYVEAHGTGTKVGDPLEATAIHNVLGQGRTAKDPLFIGSVKSNIGHLEGASGIVAVIKAAMMLERNFLLPNHDFKTPNEKIPWSEWHLKVPTTQRPFPRNKKYISVNNFGFGGTNAHVVLSKAPFPAKRSESWQSTRSATPDEKARSKKLFVRLRQRPKNSLIEALNGGKLVPGKESEPLRMGFVFTGQGAQWYGMGRELFEQYPIYAAAIARADDCLRAFGADWSLVEELNRDAKTSKVSEAHISQPSCTAVQLALTDLLTAWGIRPTAVVGHSSGEIGAAYAAGVISFEAAMSVAYHRGRMIPVLKQRFPDLKGAMMAVGGTKEEVQPIIDAIPNIRIACFNSPSSLTISGDSAGLDDLSQVVEAKQMFNRRLQVDVGYHSHHMNLVAKEYRSAIETLPTPQKTTVRFHSSLHGVEIDGTECESHYWVNNLTCPVRFAEAFETMLQPVGDHKTGVNMILELGPHSALQGPIKQILKEIGGPAAKVPYASALARKKDAVESAMDLAATLITKGAMLNMDAINFPQSDALSMAKPPTLLTDLPRYAWNRQTRYWHESRMTRMHKHREGARSDIIGVEAIYSSDLEPTWRNMVHLDDLPWLRHHKVQGLTIYPFSGFVAMALEAAAQWSKRKEIAFDRFELRGVNVVKPLALSDTADVEMTISLRPQQETSSASTEAWYEFRICSWSQASGWTENCTGRVATQRHASNDVESAEQKAAWRRGAQAIVSSLSDAVAIKEAAMYDSLAELGVGYGPAFQGVAECKASDVCSVGNIISPDVAQDMPNNYMTSMVLHPTFLESAIEMYWPVLGAGRESINTVYLPSSLNRMVVSADITALTKDAGSSLRAFCEAKFPAAASEPQPTQVSVLAASSEDSQDLILEIDGLTVSPLLDGTIEADSNPARELCYKIEWESITSFEEKPLLSTADIVIIHGESNSQQLIANGLAIAIASVTGKLPEMGGLGEVATEGKLCVVLTEIDSPFLAAPTESQFASVQKMLTTVQGALWVVRGAYAGSTSPESNMILGLSRTVRSEAVLPFATMDLDGTSLFNDSEASSAIMKVFGLVFGVNALSLSRELEFMERRGEFFTPRIVRDEVMNEHVHRETNPDVVEAQPFGQGDRMLRMDFSVTGDVSHFVDDEAGQAPVADDEVEFEVKAVGINLRDAVLAKSHVPDAERHAPGVEASGVITRIGSAVTSFCVGDAIAALTFNSSAFATRARASASRVFKFPETLSFKDAASLPLAYCTAHYALIDQVRLEAGQRVLVHAAGSGIGQAALHLAQVIGAEVFVTVGSAEEKALVMGSFDVSEDHIFYSQDLSFGPAIRHVTANDGVDVVLNLLPGAESLRESWACLSRFGHLVDVERGDGNSGARLNLGQSNNNACFMSVDVFNLAQYRPKVVERLVASVAKLVRDGKVRSLATSMDYGISAVDAAFKALQSGPVFGKVVVVPQADEMVMATQSKTVDALLQAQATYVLIGGTGGLGRSMARWMVAHGARNLVLLSRRGSITDNVRVLIEEASARGANIAVRSCDVADKASVDRLFTCQLDGLPPVRGVIHGAMVLKDVLFEKMTWSDYSTVINSKVQGAWNVHEALMRQDAKLDFFIAISSASGAVGNRGQAAYAAANTYLNALVQHRLAQGLPATSLDLTAVSDAGYLADSGAERAAEVAKNLGSDSICEAEVLALISAAISGKTSVCNEHVVTGMRITSTVQPFWTPDAKFKTMRVAAEEQAAAEAGAAGCAAVSLNASLRAARSEADAEAVVCAGLVDKIAAVLMMEPEELDVTRSLSHYPLDSLVAIEIRNFITRELEANMQVLELLSSGSIQTLTRTVCKKSKCCVGLEWTES
ncbi:fatty acid synthase S-acetyltransferase [Verticillium alfalfae VaMs.102]|uniref:Fatty acid synthase S-acetyltransferase n=1 Tax=Verticillium alfalfae (strain VaMs.102 / ATCC MYA-4576 / FGSC 10136) TaxID=526221 RepID=C9S8X8_VERA1|nr:fatty acid synthase S-acetyltransferase [Verticillium alfalfae VaMs.102]EEY14055.1 fatty acid synthase S-acetyltransferase [Verticillium alfalfae VaMs.102]